VHHLSLCSKPALLVGDSGGIRPVAGVELLDRGRQCLVPGTATPVSRSIKTPVLYSKRRTEAHENAPKRGAIGVNYWGQTFGPQVRYDANNPHGVHQRPPDRLPRFERTLDD
jgi:hypothetical protein